MYAADVAVEQDTHMGTVLVNDHQPGLGGREDETPLELQVNRLQVAQWQDCFLFLGLHWGNCTLIGHLRQALAFLPLKVGKQLVPVAHHTVIRGRVMPRRGVALP